MAILLKRFLRYLKNQLLFPKALNPLGRCEWLLYHYSPTNNAAKAFIPPYLNCEVSICDKVIWGHAWQECLWHLTVLKSVLQSVNQSFGFPQNVHLTHTAAFFLTVSSLVRMHLTSCLSVLKQAGKHDMIKCRLWLRCCNKIISSYSRQTMEALTSMWTHATNKGSPLDVMMVCFYIFKHFMSLYLSIVEVFESLKL